MNQFLLIFLFVLAFTFGAEREIQKEGNSLDEIDVSDYVLPDEFFPENDRDAIPVFQLTPNVDVSHYLLPEEFYPENDRDAIPSRRSFSRRPSPKFPQRFVQPFHVRKAGKLRGMKNEEPTLEWKMRMRRRNQRMMWPLVDGGRIFDYCCPLNRY